jgi:hypothetical protein
MYHSYCTYSQVHTTHIRFLLFSMKNMLARSGTLEDIPEPGSLPAGQDNPSSRAGISRCSLQGTLLSVCTVKR